MFWSIYNNTLSGVTHGFEKPVNQGCSSSQREYHIHYSRAVAREELTFIGFGGVRKKVTDSKGIFTATLCVRSGTRNEY